MFNYDDRDIELSENEPKPDYKKPKKPEPVTCKYCNKKNLKWVETQYGWRLRDNKGVHVCKEYNKENKEDEPK